MSDIFRSYISKVYVQSVAENDDVIVVSTKYLSPEGDYFTLDRRAIDPTLLLTTSSLDELRPEVSDVYPFKIVPPVLEDGTTSLVSRTLISPVTASQNYYVPIYFERLEADIIRNITKEFTELTVIDSNA